MSVDNGQRRHKLSFIMCIRNNPSLVVIAGQGQEHRVRGDLIAAVVLVWRLAGLVLGHVVLT